MESIDVITEFYDFIGTDEVLSRGRANSRDFTRKSKMDFSDDIGFMITRGSGNTTVELDKYSSTSGLEPVTRQAYCISRQKIKPGILKYLNNWLIARIYGLDTYLTWRGYLILAIDGCLLDLPWIEELKNEYGGSTKNGEIVAIKAQASGLYDCLNKTMIDFEMAPYNVSEKALALKNIENSMDLIKDKNPLLIFDRYYPSLEFFDHLLTLETNFLFRLKASFYKEEISKMETDDEIVSIKITDSRLNSIKDPEVREKLEKINQFNLRVTRVKLDSEEKEEEELLISNLPFEDFSTSDMKNLYNLRWKIETSYDTLKNASEIERITAKKRITVEQDFHSTIINYNLSQEIIKDAEKELDEDKKEHYKINIKTSIILIKNWINIILNSETLSQLKTEYHKLKEKIKKSLVQIVPNRKFPRLKKANNTKYHLNGK